MSRVVEIQDIADLAIFLASARAGMVTGTAINVAGKVGIRHLDAGATARHRVRSTMRKETADEHFLHEIAFDSVGQRAERLREGLRSDTRQRDGARRTK